MISLAQASFSESQHPAKSPKGFKTPAEDEVVLMFRKWVPLNALYKDPSVSVLRALSPCGHWET